MLAGLFGAILLVGVVTSAVRIRRANERRRETLKITQSAIEVCPTGNRDKMEVVPFHAITETKVRTGGDDGIDRVIAHSTGKLRLDEDRFDTRASFEEFAALVAARSRRYLKRVWFT